MCTDGSPYLLGVYMHARIYTDLQNVPPISTVVSGSDTKIGINVIRKMSAMGVVISQRSGLVLDTGEFAAVVD